MFGSSLCWIRRDLRTEDHRALAEATRLSERVAVVFVFDQEILDKLVDKDDRRLTFIHQSLADVREALRGYGSDIVVLHGNPVDVIPELAEQLGVDAVFWNADIEPYALKRDKEVHRRLVASGRQSKHFKDHVVFTAREVRNQAGGPFRVFTPYSKVWRARLTAADLAPHEPDPTRFWPSDDLGARTELSFPTLADLGFAPNDLWLQPGRKGGIERLRAFEALIDAYGVDRDRVDLDATSGLSVHLRHGTISIREAVRMAQERNTPGAEKWLSELIWRDFYQMILEEFPHVMESTFREEYAQMEWPGQIGHFQSWSEGKTGFPIVDAAMRCFNATGWMHNRLRMVVAMFLTKDLLLDWKLGEAYFARKLLDFDLASNSGGWQWSASVGVDAQPYFRVFNPKLQSLKADPEGTFIAQWCPELAEFEPDLRHWPHDATPMQQEMAGCRLGEEYPHPLVDHHEQKEKAIALLGQFAKKG